MLGQRFFTAVSLATLCVSGSLAQLSDAEKALAGQLECNHFKRNADGSWTGGTMARIGKMMAGAQTFVRGGFKVGGADVATVLDAKCGQQKKPTGSH